MAIDPLSEQVISLKQAAKLFPRNERGKRPHISCLYRYTKTGLRGVLVESIQAGSVRATSREAVARFFSRLTKQSATPSRPETRNSHARSADEAGQILDNTAFKSRQGDVEGES